jgi:hypothetical protein
MARSNCWNSKVSAARVGGLFFPQREALGLDSRELTPCLVRRIAYAATETRSEERASLVLREVGGNQVSDSTICRLTRQLGTELAAVRDHGPEGHSLAQSAQAPPELAVVQCDGGRIRTRQPGRGRGVHDPLWRETKNACLLRMAHSTFEADPQPELPVAFCDPKHVAEIAEMAAPPPESEVPVFEPDPVDIPDWRPKRLVRTCLSSMADSHTFGQQMQQEAHHRRFFEARFRAFLGDGLPWNWSIWKQQFPNFIPILDFIHVLVYLYAAALTMHAEFREAWPCYLEMARDCWQGRVAEVIGRLEAWLVQQGMPDGKPNDDDPRKAASDAARYLTHNRERMDYPRYRCLGLPVTTALMESLVKQINYRVKGTEMFWDDPAGAEAILQLRAAALCDDGRLERYLQTRPGSPYVRRSTTAIAA